MGGPEWSASGAGVFKVFRKLSEIVDPPPAKAWVLIDEREEGLNDAYFPVDMAGYPASPELTKIIDYPANRHFGGANLSFADGHVEQWIWQDPRTTPPRINRNMPVNQVSSNNLDVIRLQSSATRRR